jgi:hypothetical protein
MHEFTTLKTAASYAMWARRPMFVFDGPEGGYVVAGARQACELMDAGLVPLSLQQTAREARP